MNTTIIKEICDRLQIKEYQVKAVLELLQDGNTIPFIARYRKERTGALDEEVIRQVAEVYQYQENLWKRKEDVIRFIAEKGLLTDLLKEEILSCQKLVEVEDLYRPYKEKKKTKATIAIQKGLEPLAKEILTFPVDGDLETLTKPYFNEQVSSSEEALAGARDIIAEMLSDQAKYRKWIRKFLYQHGTMVVTKKKKAEDPQFVYEMYYDYQEAVKRLRPHRILAINRGEKEGILSVSIAFEEEPVISFLEKQVIKNPRSFVVPIVSMAIRDSLKRLLIPSIEREIRSDLKEVGEDAAIRNFADNVEKLLLTPPLKNVVVMGYDPAYRTGCKLAVLDSTGKPLDIAVIYPTPPHNKIEESKRIFLDLIEKYHIDVIAIGNGTASRESEAFVVRCVKESKRKVSYVIVNEAGASVYSASKLAIAEFPDLTVEKRSAISIGRRLQDALSELVKIDPKSIGVGLYQHDVPEKKLDDSLTFVVTKVVNQVGINLNTASRSLLQYISGMNKRSIDGILTYRDQHGTIQNRSELRTIKGMTPKIFEQSIGFMRVLNGSNPLDRTSIHPDFYPVVERLLDQLHLSLSTMGSSDFKDRLASVNSEEMAKELGIDAYTMHDILLDLQKPNRDPRDSMPQPLLRSDILRLEDLQVGDKLQGTVRNVVDFGVFIDVGLHDDGLAHISKLANHYIKHPSEVVSVGDIVDCYVLEIQKEKQKLSLSLLPIDSVVVEQK